MTSGYTVDCPTCKHLNDLVGKIKIFLNTVTGAYLFARLRVENKDSNEERIYPSSLRVECQTCKNHREVLTEEGAYLAELAFDQAMRLGKFADRTSAPTIGDLRKLIEQETKDEQP